MYITIIDFSTSTLSTLAWDADIETTDTDAVEELLCRCGYHLSQISYMATEDEPDYGGIVEVSDILDN